jgi:Ras GTPase-activating-like protein IQGAP2/3
LQKNPKKLPAIFYPETTDIYDMKNMPRLCYCIHALSMHMFKLGLAPQIHDLEGQLKFTAEEITAMQEALDKYNIQLPVFSKIGGLLASEISIDEASLHAAILAINQALDNPDATDLEEKIQNPDAHLVDVDASRIKVYHSKLVDEKQKKILAGLQKSGLGESEPDADASFKIMEENGDVYAVNLTQLEIQGHLKKINREISLENFAISLSTSNAALLRQTAKELKLKNYKSENDEIYFGLGSEFLEQIEISQIEALIAKGNQIGAENDAREATLFKIKKSIKARDSHQLLEHLSNPNPITPAKITKARGDIYLAELESYEELTSELLSGNIMTISSVANINKNLENGNCDEVLETLHELEIDSVDISNKVIYYEALQDANFNNSNSQNYLDIDSIQQIIYRVNSQQDFYQEQLLAVQKVNEAVIESNEELVFESLNSKILNLPALEIQHSPRYMSLLQYHLEKNEELGLQAIQASVERCHQQFEVMKKKCSAVVAINLLLLDDDIDEDQLLEMLQTDVLEYHIIEECLPAYINSLMQANSERIVMEDNGWITEVIGGDNSLFYFDTDNFKGHWTPPENHNHTQGMF